MADDIKVINVRDGVAPTKARKWLAKQNKNVKSKEEDPFPGDAPIPLDRLKKHSRGKAVDLHHGVKTTFKRREISKKEKKTKLAARLAARAELLLPEESGFLEPDTDEFTSQFTQTEIVRSVDITSATKQFDLNLKFGQYAIDYSRNGRKLLIGGRLGHLAALDWVTKDLICELNAMEAVYDVAWLHNETMFAAAQKEWTYIYDNQGIEVHCIKQLDKVLKLEFLPYHFLLASANEKGWLSWLDVSIGKLVKQTSTKLGRLDVMCHNPYNAVLCAGHSKGTVTMWTPNVETPVAKMLCHRQPVRACAVDQRGLYLATAAVDSTVKVWDVRTFKCLQSYRLGCGASHLAFSQRGILAVSMGNIVEVYKDCCTEAVTYPYLKHHVGNSVSGLQFCPYEDVLGVGHSSGMCSMLVPGAGEPNFDAIESNPFQTKSQRREAEVKSLLEKIQPELITLDPSQLGDVDTPMLEDKLAQKKKLLFVKPPKVDIRSRKTDRSAKIFHNKVRVQGEARRKHIGEVNKAKKALIEEAGTTNSQAASQQKKSVLDRFKPKPKAKKSVEALL